MSSYMRKQRGIDEYSQYGKTPYVLRPLSDRQVNGATECNRLRKRIKELEAKVGSANLAAEIFQKDCEKKDRRIKELDAPISLPVLTEEMYVMFGESCLVDDDGGWSQDATDFVCFLNSLQDTDNLDDTP